jgi:hypothetical protein
VKQGEASRALSTTKKETMRTARGPAATKGRSAARTVRVANGGAVSRHVNGGLG